MSGINALCNDLCDVLKTIFLCLLRIILRDNTFLLITYNNEEYTLKRPYFVPKNHLILNIELRSLQSLVLQTATNHQLPHHPCSNTLSISAETRARFMFLHSQKK